MSTFLRAFIIMLASILGMGFLPVVNAKTTWVKADIARTQYCPDVCAITKEFHPKHPAFNVPHAVPSGLHTHPKVNKLHYVCAGNPVGKGWGIGFNIEKIKHQCHVAFLYKTGPKLLSLEYYYCLCSDESVEPIKPK